MINVIIPVYSGLAETRRCIESVLRAKNKLNHRITIIDDCSPDPELTNYLISLPQGGNVQILRNEQNLGFVKTANHGMVLDLDADVILLNSDTEVSGDWLDRLHRCAYSTPNIGTATPFSNNATICSYPNYCGNNTLPEGWNTTKIDAIFQKANIGKYVEIPTAVGFCMYIKRSCLKEVGLFDAETFGKGYGEENDFCMRARRDGWRHVLCADTFVYHTGGVSFAGTQNTRKQTAQKIVDQCYPHYPYLIRWHIKRDPARALRHAVDFMRIRSEGKQVILFVSHRRGGGTERHLQELCELVKQDAEILVLRPFYLHEVVLVWQKPGEALKLFFNLNKDYPSLLRFLQLFGVSRIHFHHLIGHPHMVKNIALDLNVPFDVTLHDYHQICPRVSLSSTNNKYCGEPDEQVCNKCLRTPPHSEVKDIHKWRNGNLSLLNKAQRLFVPSLDTARRIQRYVSGNNVVIAPHFDIQNTGDLPIPAASFLEEHESLRILVLGALSSIKGPDILERCALLAKSSGLPMQFHLIGYAYRKLETKPKSNLTIHGPYKESDLPHLIAQSRPHLVWFPAQIPETYSYTLSTALLAGLPLVVPNIGAFAERVANRPLTWVCPWDWESERWTTFFIELRESNFGMISPIANSPDNISPPKYFDYKNYLIPVPPPPLISEIDMEEIGTFLKTHSRHRLNFLILLTMDLLSMFYSPRIKLWVRRISPYFERFGLRL